MIGVKFPFTITGGSIAMTSNASEIAGSQVVFCLGTQAGERLMRPEWGVNILDTVYSLGGSMDSAMREGIENAFAQFFPDYEPREITINRLPSDPTRADITVRFGRYNTDVDMSVRVGTQLPDGTEIYPDEGL